MHLFVFRVKPTTGAIGAQDVGGGQAIVLICDQTDKRAEVAARALVLSHGWLIEELEEAYAADHFADVDPDFARCQALAKQHGSAVLFVGWRREERSDDSPVVRRSLPKRTPNGMQ